MSIVRRKSTESRESNRNPGLKSLVDLTIRAGSGEVQKYTFANGTIAVAKQDRTEKNLVAIPLTVSELKSLEYCALYWPDRGTCEIGFDGGVGRWLGSEKVK